ncbi:ABC-2 family transporter protein [Streptomyces sp. NPDC006552]|uniref:ABC transporter permease n=1 Tax=Streptomyces sp. NPDC006552 TaxID=3157179 RepID=UPI0033A43DF7
MKARYVPRVILVGRVTALTEVLLSGRLMGTLLRVVFWIAVSVTLWHALYAHAPTAAGMTVDQTVTYVVVAAMVTQLRAGALTADTLADHISAGTVLYWFLRPMKPRAYYFARALGDTLYALTWVTVGYIVCLSFGVLAGPTTTTVGLIALLSLVLGQVIAHELRLLVDLVCFWTVVNRQVIKLTEFVQTFLSGGFAPLWFFPEWFQKASAIAPFGYVVNIPMSIYTGRTHGAGIGQSLVAQLVWAAALAALNRWIWSRAVCRVGVQGG